jgi:hypothetical protein
LGRWTGASGDWISGAFGDIFNVTVIGQVGSPPSRKRRGWRRAWRRRQVSLLGERQHVRAERDRNIGRGSRRSS